MLRRPPTTLQLTPEDLNLYGLSRARRLEAARHRELLEAQYLQNRGALRTAYSSQGTADIEPVLSSPASAGQASDESFSFTSTTGPAAPQQSRRSRDGMMHGQDRPAPPVFRMPASVRAQAQALLDEDWDSDVSMDAADTPTGANNGLARAAVAARADKRIVTARYGAGQAGSSAAAAASRGEWSSRDITPDGPRSRHERITGLPNASRPPDMPEQGDAPRNARRGLR